MSRKRLSKKQLKGDKFVERTFDWAHWIETHRSQAIGVVVILLLMAAGLFAWRQMSRSAEEGASVAYGQARQAYFAGNWQLAVADLQGFLNRYGDSTYAVDARFFLADAYYQAGQYQPAVQSLEEFLDDYGDSPFAENARQLLAASYQQMGQFPQAIAVYERAIESTDSDVAKINYRNAMARIYASQGDIEGAANQYRAIVEIDPEGDAAREARRKLAELSVEPLGAPSTGGEEEAVAPDTTRPS
jgi:predicted negative regulator of RcsB-dependent stress response